MGRGRKVHRANDRVQTHMRLEARDLVAIETPLAFKDVARRREAEFLALERDYHRAKHADARVLLAKEEVEAAAKARISRRPKRDVDSDAWLEDVLLDNELIEETAPNQYHADRIGVYRQPEPKSILSPAPKSRLRFEPPVKRYNPNI